MTTLTLTGWGQSPESLRNIAPESIPLDYASYESLEAFLATLPPSCDTLIGWSFGGQLAIRVTPLLRPKLLVLIATPYRLGDFDDFAAKFHAAPEMMLKRLGTIIAKGDSHEKEVLRKLTPEMHPRHLSYWLELLKAGDMEKMDMTDFPPTIIIHGTNDAVVPVSQAQQLAEKIPGSRLILIGNCGHAPHLHDPRKLRDAIESAT